jgi:hypothetical protein
MPSRNISGFSVSTPRSLAVSPTIQSQKDFDEFFPAPVILVPLPSEHQENPKRLVAQDTHMGTGEPDFAPAPVEKFFDAVIFPLAAGKGGEPGRVTIGRGAEDDVMVPVYTVSRRHGSFALGATCTYQDRGSTNGSWVRGKVVLPNQPVSLANGDEVALGPNVRVLFLTPTGLLAMARLLRGA